MQEPLSGLRFHLSSAASEKTPPGPPDNIQAFSLPCPPASSWHGRPQRKWQEPALAVSCQPHQLGHRSGAVGRARWERCRRWENIAMGCAGVSRKPFKHSQPQQFAQETQISFLSLLLPVCWGFVFFFLKQSLLLAPPTPGTAFVGDLSPSESGWACSGGLREPSRTPNPSGDSKLLFTLLPWSCSGALQQFLWSQGFRGIRGCWGWGTLPGCPRAWLEIPTWLLEGGAEPLAG